MLAGVVAPVATTTGTLRPAAVAVFAAETAPALPATAAVEPVYAIPKRP